MGVTQWNKSLFCALGLLCLVWVGAFYLAPNSSIPRGSTLLASTGNGIVGAFVGEGGSRKIDHEYSQSHNGVANAGKTGELVKTISIPLDPTRVALLLETRPLPHLPALLAHFISVLPPPWVFRFVGSPEANALISSSSLSSHIETGKLVVDKLPPKYDIKSQESISVTLTDFAFYHDFLAPAEWVLMFQSDSMICAASEHHIENFISAKYSWVGAPWNMGVRGGNGGLSLRHVPPILNITEKEIRQPGDVWEDRWLCDRLNMMEGANMPQPEIALQFSVESQWTERPLGYHLRSSGNPSGMVMDIWGDKERRKQILKYCPEVKIIFDVEAFFDSL